MSSQFNYAAFSNFTAMIEGDNFLPAYSLRHFGTHKHLLKLEFLKH